MGKYGLGTAFGNRVERQYLVNATYAKSATSEQGRKTFLAVVDLFRKYSDQYKVDFLLMAAQGYQESRLNQNARSPVGAIGIMQIMPETGAVTEGRRHHGSSSRTSMPASSTCAPCGTRTSRTSRWTT